MTLSQLNTMTLTGRGGKIDNPSPFFVLCRVRRRDHEGDHRGRELLSCRDRGS
jgi:hypothetical protein